MSDDDGGVTMAKFACSILVIKPGHTRHTAFIVEAASRFEAEGLAIAIGRKVYPDSQGWHGHDAIVFPGDQVVTLESARLTGEA